MKTLLLGMGNPILRDDAVGLRLARDARARLGERTGLVIVEECCVGGLDVLEMLRGYDRAIVIDSIQTRDGIPGDWYQFDASALRETAHLASTHDANLATALEVGRRVGMKLPEPREIHVFAVEVEDGLTFSERMTPALEEAYPRYSEAILSAVEKVVLESGPSAAGPCQPRRESPPDGSDRA